jgi:hypothetical protein
MEDFNFVEMIRLVIGLVEHRCGVSLMWSPFTGTWRYHWYDFVYEERPHPKISLLFYSETS